MFISVILITKIAKWLKKRPITKKLLQYPYENAMYVLAIVNS